MRFPWSTSPTRRGGSTAGLALALVCAAALAAVPRAALATGGAPTSDTTPLPVIASPGPAVADNDIKARLDAPGALTIGGEPVHAALLRKFYAGHNYEPVWATRQAQAMALWHAVLHAGDQGLDPDGFHVAAFAKTQLSAADRDMLLSDAFLAYADALSRGAVPAEMRIEDEALSPEPADVVAALDAALNNVDTESENVA